MTPHSHRPITVEPRSEFLEWFELQFGKRPSKLPLHVLQENARRCRVDLYNAEKALEESQLWDQRKTAAHYAWVAREKR
jgi:hypothetical protein